MPFYFRLPVITDLTIEQQAALNETRAIAVSGGPGTGKSVVSLWRHIQNHSMGRRNSLLLTYTKSLEYYLRASASSENERAGENVNRTYWWTTHLACDDFEEIIIDEAQDVEEKRYEKIKELAEMVSYCADNNQIVYPNRSTTEERLRVLFENNIQIPRLQENYRNTNEIVRFVRSLFPTTLITESTESGPKPTVILSNRNHQMSKTIINDIIQNFKSETHNIAILVPLQKNVNIWHKAISEMGIECSKFSNDDGDIGIIANVHITTFKSSKGLEFDTVIIPEFDEYKINLKRFDVVKENDYYVVFTRARRNLFLIDNSGNSRTDCKLEFLQLSIRNETLLIDNSYANSGLAATVHQNQQILPSLAASSEPDFDISFDDILPF